MATPTTSGGNGFGGAVDAFSGNVTLRNDTFDSDFAQGGNGGNGGIGFSSSCGGGRGGNGFGGGLYVASGASVTATGSTVTQNLAQGGPGEAGNGDGNRASARDDGLVILTALRIP
jgi:hypothetical protein